MLPNERKHMTAKLNRFIADGFDNSELAKGFVRVRCSQCATMIINGMATHETGCPNQTFECHGCDARVESRHQKYCADCQ